MSRLMPVESYLENLRQRGVRLWLEGDKLGFQAPKGTLSPADIAELRERKPEVIDLLRLAEAAAAPPPALTPTPRTDAMPQSFAQQRLWFLYHLNGPDAAYNIVDRRRLTGPLDPQALEQAFIELSRRHEILRTTFATRDGAPVQIIHAEPRLDFAYLPTGDPQALAAQEAAHCFLLEQGPLLRVRLIRTAAGQHILLLTAHHIIADGWTLGRFFAELSALYRAFRNNQPSPLPTPTLHYADYAHWQQQWLSGPALESRLSYWKTRIEGAPPLLELFPDQQRPAPQTTQGASQPVRIAAPVAQRFKQLCQQHGSTVFMGMLAVMQALLARYIGTRDIVLGTQTAGRDRAELEGIAGFLVNTLALRTDVDLTLAFPQLLDRVRAAALDAIAHQDVPFEKVVEALQPERLPGRNPLVQTMLLWQNAPTHDLAFDQVQLQPFEAGGRITAKFDLTLEMGETAGGFEGVLEYRTGLYTPAEMERFAGHIATLVEAIADQPSRALQAQPLLTAAERHTLHRWAAGDPMPPWPEASLIARFEQQARQHPNRFALVFDNVALTYAELSDRAGQLATWLRQQGARPDRPIALHMEPSADLIVAMLGVLKAGSFYLPLDTRTPEARRAVMLEDAEATLVLTELPPLTGLPPTTAATPSDFAYLIYTSGSTGTPKGVLIGQRSVLNLAQWLGRDVFPQSPVRAALFASCAFDASVQQIFGSLLNGHTLYPIDAASRRDAAALGRFYAQHQIALADGTPTLLALLCDARIPADPTLALRHLLIGGEALPTSLLRSFHQQDHTQRITIWNVYGPTECCVDSTVLRIDPAQPGTTAAASIGRPIPNSEILILDPAGHPTPEGVPGEICIAGAGVGHGYWRRPELTATAFIPHPQRPNERLYRTGDRGYWNAAGCIEFLGRADDQVKIRGHRIQLGDIESHLARHSGVRHAVVIARPNAAGHNELLAYLAADPTLTVLDLRAFLSQSLPEYMLPAAFVILEQLPVNASGKIDRRRLPAPDAAPQAQQGTAFLAPRTDTERALVEVWTHVLGRDRIGIRDHYIALGGDSIKALQIAARLRDAGWKLELSHLFLHPRIEDLAPLLQPVQAAPVDEPATGDAPLAPAQARFFHTFDGDPGWFNQTVLLQPTEPLDPQALRRALDAIYTHHDLLRARFPGRRQHIGPPGAPAPFRIAEGPYNPQQPPRFDLENGPLFQAVLHPDRLLLAAHHLVIDGVSWRILLEDLETAYRGATLPAKTTPFRAWAASLPPVAEAAPIPQDPDPCRAADCATHTVGLSRSLTTDVLERCHEAYGTESNDILLTALARAWQRHSGDTAVDVLLESHGRQTHNPAHDLSRTIGWFTAMDPVRLDLGTTADPGRHIKLVKETLRARPKGDPIPAPRLVFNYLGQFGGASGPALFTRAPEDPGPMADPNATFPHDLEINGAAYDGHLEFTFSFHPRRLTAPTAARLADAFVEELERLTTHAIGRGTTELTPSDIDYNGFNMDEMDLFLNNLPAEESR